LEGVSFIRDVTGRNFRLNSPNPPKNIVGLRYGWLTVIKQISGTGSCRGRFLCQCDCGNSKEVAGRHLTFGKTRSCGCLQRDMRYGSTLDLRGCKVGFLTVVRFGGMAKDRHGTWIARCICGKEVRLTPFQIHKPRGQRSCGCMKRNEDRNLVNVICSIKHGAKSRGYSFTLRSERVRELVLLPCYLCGAAPSQVTNCPGHPPFVHNGLDRIDNKLGYDEGNCAPCCTACNRAKSTMSIEEFDKWIERVYSHRHSKP
jgi:hypothetical protein